jgi:hypothetical protein
LHTRQVHPVVSHLPNTGPDFDGRAAPEAAELGEKRPAVVSRFGQVSGPVSIVVAPIGAARG